MPLNLQQNLPAIELLKKEHIFVTGGETGHPAAASGRVESDAAENNY